MEPIRLYLDIGEVLFVIGRVMLGSLFALGAVRHLFIMPVLIGMMQARGIPAAGLVLWIGTIFELVCGVAFIIGEQTALAGFGLILFTLAASVMMLDFWRQTGQEREMSIQGWMTNTAVTGGLLIAIAHAS